MAHILKEEHNLGNWLSSVSRETHVLKSVMMIEAVLAPLLLIAGIVLFFLTGGKGVLIAGGIALFLAAGHWMKLYENYRTARNVRSGREGEMLIANAFRDGLDDSWYIINDIDLRFGRMKSQIDHIIIGPNGLFVLETKSWAGHLTGTEKDPTWRQRKTGRNGKIIDHDLKSPILQNLRHCETVSALIQAARLDWPDIYSVIVLTRNDTHADITAVTPVVHPAGAVEYVAAKKPTRTYGLHEIAAAIAVLLPGTCLAPPATQQEP